MSSIERAMDAGRRRGAGPAASAREPLAPTNPEAARPESEPSAKAKRVVELDLVELRRRGLVTPEGSDPRLEEEYRLAKRPILKQAFPRGLDAAPRANLALITSSTPGEGKTFTAFNLAMSIATEMDHTVLLVDGDVTRSTLTRWLGMAGQPGLTDVLDDPDVGLGQVITATNLAKLRVIPAGRPHARATELMASGAMDRIAEDLAGRYPDRMVLFDSSPLLMASQSPVLANLVGQVVMVVEAGRTPQQSVRDALNLIDQSATKVGFLLNKTPVGKHSGYFGAY
ncbi:MAG TPA: XrtA-associated tyrosine autokinase [Gammaproteobacteria bacterium]|nr:XrtA-associated tyrosine autokinase [Gammaproteobacteria bacterium]